MVFKLKNLVHKVVIFGLMPLFLNLAAYALIQIGIIVEIVTVRDSSYLAFYATSGICTWFGGLKNGFISILISTYFTYLIILREDKALTDPKLILLVAIYLFGEIMTVIGVRKIHDIHMTLFENKSKLKDIEISLETSNSQLQTILENVADGVVIRRLDGRTVFVNEEVAKILGFLSTSDYMKVAEYNTYEKILLSRFKLFIESGKEVKSLNSLVIHRLPIEKRIDLILCFRNRITKKEKWYIARVSAVFNKLNNNIEFIITILTDITERKIQEQRKDEFISIASHELKTPITTLKAFTQLLKKYTTIDEAKRYLSRMEYQVNRLVNIVNVLLDISRIQTGQFSLVRNVFNLNELVRNLTSDLNVLYVNPRVIIKRNDEVTLNADEKKIEQAITNLVTNALKFSPQDSFVEISITKLDDEVVLSVRDHGVGMPKEIKALVFKKFFKGESEGGIIYGLGLGLYISKEIIKAHGGKIWVNTKLNKGSTFSFSLPLNFKLITKKDHDK